MRLVRRGGAAVNVGQPVAALRVIPMRLLGIDGQGLPLDHVFQFGDVLLSLAGATFAIATYLPLPVAGGRPGTFNLPLAVEEIATTGVLRVQVLSATVQLYEDVSLVTTAAPVAPPPLASLRVFPIRLMGIDNQGLPLDYAFSVGECKVSLGGVAFANTNHLPVAVEGGSAGSFNLPLDASELADVGILRLQIYNVDSIVLYEDTEYIDIPYPQTDASSWTPVSAGGGASWSPA